MMLAIILLSTFDTSYASVMQESLYRLHFMINFYG
jgi:hypothetical protein